MWHDAHTAPDGVPSDVGEAGREGDPGQSAPCSRGRPPLRCGWCRLELPSQTPHPPTPTPRDRTWTRPRGPEGGGGGGGGGGGLELDIATERDRVGGAPQLCASLDQLTHFDVVEDGRRFAGVRRVGGDEDRDDLGAGAEGRLSDAGE